MTQWKPRQQTTRPLRLLHPRNLHFLTDQEQEAGHAKTSSWFHLHETLNNNFKEIVNQNCFTYKHSKYQFPKVSYGLEIREPD